jgi:hypothetical protein
MVGASRKYWAASVPRHVRLARPGFLPQSCVIGTRIVRNANTNMFIDVVMMLASEFRIMRTNISVNLVLAPALKLGANLPEPGFIFTDIREVVVPADEPDPYNFAKNYFLQKFCLVAADNPIPDLPMTSRGHIPRKIATSGMSEFLTFSDEMFSCRKLPPREKKF